MLTSWSLQNFKAISNSGQVALAPVTVLAGLNSAGKTSFLQSILMVAQTLSNPFLDRSLLPNGPMVQLGTFDDILNRSSSTHTMTIGFEFSEEKPEEVDFDENDEPFVIPGPYVRSMRAVIRFRGAPQSALRPSAIEASRVYTEYASFRLTSWDEIGFHSLLFGNECTEQNFTLREVDEETINRLLKESDSDQIQRFSYRNQRPQHSGDFDISDEGKRDNYLLALSHFLPSRLVYRFSQTEHRLHLLRTELSLFLNSEASTFATGPSSLFKTRAGSFEQGKEALQQFFTEKHLAFTFNGTSFLELIRWYRSFVTDLPQDQFPSLREEVAAILIQSILDQEIAQALAEKQYTHELDLLDAMNITIQAKEALLDRAIDDIVGFFTRKIRYLGPLRADPQATQKYPFNNEFDDVGSKGEYAAAVYEANQEKQVEWYNPFTQQVKREKLCHALDSWMQYLSIAHGVTIETAGTSGFRWQVFPKDGQAPLPLASVGIGISQVLPILVMGLVSSANTLLIIEQPELHLHPRVQSRIGDFFLGLAACRKQCLIETHSENLVNQLRYHIVQSGGQEKSQCAIYFAQQDEQGATSFLPVVISSRGNILNWPDGFFDETFLQQDRITEESLRQRAQQITHDEHSS